MKIDINKFRKSASIYKNAFRAVPSDPVLQLWQGIGEIKSKNTSEGKKNLVLALKAIDKDFGHGHVHFDLATLPTSILTWPPCQPMDNVYVGAVPLEVTKAIISKNR